MEVTMEIDVADYLSEDKIEEIVREQIARQAAEHLGRNEYDFKRIISNIGYEMVFDMISETLGKDVRKELKCKVGELLQSDSSIRYAMFRRKSCFDEEESPPLTIMNEEINAHRDLIVGRIEQEIKDYDFREIKDEISECIFDVICRKFNFD